MEEQMNIEESEIQTILCIIADRLGQLEDRTAAGSEPEFYEPNAEGFCYKCRKGHTECCCNRISLELETAITNLNAEIAMATNALPSRRVAGITAALRNLEEVAGYPIDATA
jgi:hypothetical protein